MSSAGISSPLFHGAELTLTRKPSIRWRRLLPSTVTWTLPGALLT
jgi:hypothetical protein